VGGAWLSDQCTIVLPSLWIFEAGNILGLKQSNLSVSLMRILIGYGFEEASPEGFYEKAFELMKTFKVTFYDAAYHAVAIRRSGTMITADEAYYKNRRAPVMSQYSGSGLHNWVVQLRRKHSGRLEVASGNHPA